MTLRVLRPSAAQVVQRRQLSASRLRANSQGASQPASVSSRSAAGYRTQRHPWGQFRHSRSHSAEELRAIATLSWPIRCDSQRRLSPHGHQSGRMVHGTDGTVPTRRRLGSHLVNVPVPVGPTWSWLGRAVIYRCKRLRCGAKRCEAALSIDRCAGELWLR